MQAIVFEAPRALRLDTVSDPTIEHPRDALVRVRLTAVCGSDLHVYRGRETGLDAGTIMGHEFVGEVIERGADVDLALGTPVVSPFTTSCGACFYCERGLTARCTEGALFGWVQDGRGLHGAQAELVRVPLADSTLVPVPDGVDLEAALFTGDVLATGFFAADRGGVGPGRRVAVVGCGPVGLMAALSARELGAESVHAIDTVPERLSLAARYGATPVDSRTTDPAEAVRAATDGRGADVVLEAVGTPEATRLALDLARPGATIVAVGVHTEAHFGFAPGEAYDKNLVYVAGRCSARAYMERLLARVGDLDVSAVVSHRLPLSEGVRAYDIFDKKLEGCTKAVLEA
ncbi:MAG: alcohol dehydrogenase catalytic domain-containing protein [Planctomycetota bacterium]|nr:alcohol dehydrogenase catalytic domain-containing protein [Planctomycetota bacterium]